MRGRKRRFDPRQAAFSLDGFQQRCLFPANISSRAEAHFYVEIQSRTENILSDQTSLPCLIHRRAHHLEGARKLSANIDVALACADSISGDDHSFDGAVRVFFHEDTVFESSWFRFVRVADNVFRFALSFGGTLPFDAGWKSRAAAAYQSRSLYLGNYVFRRHRQCFFQSGITATGPVVRK